jgi:ceramide glucosyltransferase
MSMMITFLLLCSVVSICLYLVGVASALIHLRRRKRTYADLALPPISLLKPLKGLEENLEQCLRSFFEQDYPGEIEIVFASAQRDDPAMAVARRVAAAYPRVPARFVLSNESWGLNPKVSNLHGALSAARHDLVLQTDANVSASRDYVRRIVSELIGEHASLLSSVVSGVGERSVGAAMENLQLSAFVAPACCAALVVAGIPCVIGKSILFRQSELRALGGLELVKDSLAEDFLLGNHYVEQGKKVLLSATPIRNVNVAIGIERSLKRHARWLKMRVVINPFAFLGDLFANPIAIVGLSFAALDFRSEAGLALVGTVALKTLVDGLLASRVRGAPVKFVHALCVPLKDVLMLGVWLYAIFSRSVDWRGIRFRIGPGTQLLRDDGNLPVRVLRRLLSVEPTN